MKKTLLSIVTAAALMAATTSPLMGQANTAPAAPAPAARNGKGGHERHPEIHAALQHLQAAKQALQRGSHDFSGHREKALDLTNQAISECRDALRSDKQ